MLGEEVESSIWSCTLCRAIRLEAQLPSILFEAGQMGRREGGQLSIMSVKYRVVVGKELPYLAGSRAALASPPALQSRQAGRPPFGDLSGLDANEVVACCRPLRIAHCSAVVRCSAAAALPNETSAVHPEHCRRSSPPLWVTIC